MIIRDFYFAAYIIEKGYSYEIRDKKVDISIDKASISKYTEEYKAHKPMLSRVRNIIKDIAVKTSLEKRDA